MIQNGLSQNGYGSQVSVLRSRVSGLGSRFSEALSEAVSVAVLCGSALLRVGVCVCNMHVCTCAHVHVRVHVCACTRACAHAWKGKGTKLFSRMWVLP